MSLSLIKVRIDSNLGNSHRVHSLLLLVTQRRAKFPLRQMRRGCAVVIRTLLPSLFADGFAANATTTFQDLGSKPYYPAAKLNSLFDFGHYWSCSVNVRLRWADINLGERIG